MDDETTIYARKLRRQVWARENRIACAKAGLYFAFMLSIIIVAGVIGTCLARQCEESGGTLVWPAKCLDARDLWKNR
ncbi:MAG: hypothetical protein PVSMB8_07450 [Vulcanimicrobiaceae bacterium]